MRNASGGRGDSGAATVNTTALETVNAAATAIAAAENRAPQAAPVQVRFGAARLDSGFCLLTCFDWCAMDC